MLVPTGIPGKYKPLWFRPCARVSITTCVDLFSFLTPLGNIEFVVRKVHSWWLRDEEQQALSSDANCTSWTFPHHVPPPNMENVTDTLDPFFDSFITAVEGTITSGTHCHKK